MVTTSVEIPAPRWPARYTVVAMCFLAVFVCYLDRVNMSVAVVAMKEEFGWSDTTKGFVMSSFFLGYLMLQVVAGWLSNRIGGRWVLGFAVVWWSAFTLLTPLAAMASLPLLLATRFTLGLGEAATFPASYTLYRNWIPPNERSRAVTLLASAIPLGTLFALGITGWVVTQYGWPMAFYSFGVLGFVWAVFWFRYIYDTPALHPRLSAAERTLLAPTVEQARNPAGVPWAKFARTPAVLALVFNHFASNWAFYMLLSWLPSYFRDVQHLSVQNAGFFSAAPWLTMFVMANVAGWLADRLIRRGVSTTHVRKGMQIGGMLVSAGFLLAIRGIGDPHTAVWMMCGALGFMAFTWAGYSPNHLDIAPRYADVLMGVTNTFGTLPGVIGVAVTGWLIDVTGTYDAAFVLAAGMNVAGAIVWALWAKGERVID